MHDNWNDNNIHKKLNISEDTLSGRMINQLLILEHFEKVVKLAFYNALFTFEF